MPWWLFGWSIFWLVLFLVWSSICFKAGWHAHEDESIRQFMARFGKHRDDPPGKGGVRV
jgi:hypothetical protein